MKISESLLLDYVRHWEYCSDRNETNNLKAEFKEVCKLIREYYAPKVNQWSNIVIPIDGKDKHNMFSYSSNGLESVHRSQNRFIREYNKGNMGTVAGQLIKYYEHQCEEVEAIRNGNRKQVV